MPYAPPLPFNIYNDIYTMLKDKRKDLAVIANEGTVIEDADNDVSDSENGRSKSCPYCPHILAPRGFGRHVRTCKEKADAEARDETNRNELELNALINDSMAVPSILHNFLI